MSAKYSAGRASAFQRDQRIDIPVSGISRGIALFTMVMVQSTGAPTNRCGDDQRLVAGLRRGDADAVEALIDCYGGLIHRVAGRMLRDPRDAEEIAQDVLLTVVQKIGAFRGEAAFSSWIYRITANAAYSRLRARRERAEVSLEPLFPVFDAEGSHAQPVDDWSSRLDDPAIAGETKAALSRAIARLPEDYRMVVVLRDVEGLSSEEVADALGLTVAAVKSRLHRARLFLRRQLAHLFTMKR